MLFTIEEFFSKGNSLLNNVPSVITNENWYNAIKDILDDSTETDYYNYNFNLRVLRKGSNSTEVQQVDLIHKIVNTLFVKNNYKYKTLYETTQFVYNPIWNVDGTEERVIERESDGSNTRTFNNADTNVKTGNETIAKTGADTLTLSGSEIDSKSGNEVHTKGGNDVETTATTTFDSSTFYDKEKKTIEPNSTDTLSFNNRQDTKSFNNRQDTQGYNSTDTHTFNQVTDTNTHSGSIVDSNENTSGENELLTRQGNIGVTSTQSLIEQEREVALFSFVEVVEKDIIKSICSLIY